MNDEVKKPKLLKQRKLWKIKPFSRIKESEKLYQRDKKKEIVAKAIEEGLAEKEGEDERRGLP
ncbi:MAG: hypothetical protein AB1797_00090 [bacterium]